MPIGIYDHKNTKTPIYTKERNAKISRIQTGRKHTLEHIRKRVATYILGGKNKGVNHYNWKGGTSNSIDKLIRRSIEYKLWRTAVFERDNYTCIWCKRKRKKGDRVIIQADHIKPFALFPELRFAIDNGRTLCIECHRTTDTYGINKKILK